MHATTEQLLSLRDGRPVDAAAAAHMAECPQCRQAVRGMMRLRARLRELPELDPPPDLWQTIALQAPAARAAPEPPGHTPWYWPVGVGVAAACALTVALVLNVGQAPDDGPAPGTTTDLIAATPAPMSSVNGVTTAELLETSRQLETALRVMPAGAARSKRSRPSGGRGPAARGGGTAQGGRARDRGTEHERGRGSRSPRPGQI